MAAVAGLLAWIPPGLPRASGHEVITTDLTWTRTISRIVRAKCTRCHRSGGSAPMPLTTYAEVRPWAKAIKHEVLTRRMPPWGAVKGFGAFRNDRSLSLTEVALISSWVEGGAPEGDVIFLEPLHEHEQGVADGQLDAARLPIPGAVQLDRAVVALGISPGILSSGDWMQVTAHLPDGRVEHLLWLQGPQPASAMDYWFLRPLDLPAGTRLVSKPQGTAVELWVRDPPITSAP